MRIPEGGWSCGVATWGLGIPSSITRRIPTLTFAWGCFGYARSARAMGRSQFFTYALLALTFNVLCLVTSDPDGMLFRLSVVINGVALFWFLSTLFRIKIVPVQERRIR